MNLKCLTAYMSFQNKQLLKRIWAIITNKRTYQVINGEKVVFVHIPKAAGMSVTLTLFQKEVGHNTALYYQQTIGKKAYEDIYSFAIVRNPYDRLMSAYFFLKKGGMEKYCNDQKMSEYINSHYPTFEKFILEGLKDKRILNYYHFIPQHIFLNDHTDKRIVKHIGKLEDLDSFFQKICKDLGVKLSLPHNNKTEYNKNKQELFTEEMKIQIQTVYAKDFKELNYELD